MSGKVVIAQITLNRAKNRGLSVKDVVLQPYQFSWTIDVQYPERLPIDNPEAMIDCIAAIPICINQRNLGNNLSGATHYYNPKYADPDWKDDPRMKYITTIGNHKIYREER